MAGELSISQVRDFGLNRNGVEVSAPVAGFATNVTHVDNSYNRVGLSKDFGVTSGKFFASVSPGVAYQRTLDGTSSGYGITLGAKAGVQVSKDVNFHIGVGQFYGQNRVADFSNTTGSVGVTVKF